MRNDSGFTIVELVIVMAIIAVLTGIAGYSYLAIRPSLHLSGAARQILGDLVGSRMKAVNLNRRVKVFFLSNNREYKICDDANNDGTVGDGEGDVQLKDIQDKYSSVTFSSTANPVFSSRGTATGATVTITNAGGSKTVTVATTGRVKID